MRKLLVMVLSVCAFGGLFASLQGTASAAGLSPPVADCDANGQLTHHYSASELRQALATMPADVAEYTNCPDLIRRALLNAVGALHGGDSPGGGGSFLPGWVIAVLVVLVLAAAAAGAVAVRNRRRES